MAAEDGTLSCAERPARFESSRSRRTKVRFSLDRERGQYAKGTHEISFEPYVRYVADAADMAKIIRGEKPCDFPYAHDLAVQETVLRASGLTVS